MDAITVVGVGGIGVALGYAFRAGGVPVRFVDVNERKLANGRSHGVAVDRHPPLPAEFIHFEDWQPKSDEVIWLCTKCYDNAVVLDRIPESCTILPVQNGFDSRLNERWHAAEGIASFVSECTFDRPHTRITRSGKLHLGLRGSGQESRLEQWARSLQGARLFRVELVDDVRPFKHTKLMYNAAIGPLAAAAGLDNGQLLAVPAARRLFFDLLRENYSILTEAQLTLGKIGPFHPSTVNKILQQPSLTKALAWAFCPSLRGTYCSMAGDIEKGRTEVEFYNGYLVRIAGDRPCELNRRVCELFHRLERERRVPGLSVFEELKFKGPHPAAV